MSERLSLPLLRAPLTRTILAVALLVLPGGCSPVLHGAPERPFATSRELTRLRAAYGGEALFRYRSSPPERRAELRNGIVLGRMYAIDIAYHDYETALTREQQQIPFAASIASIALSGTGAAIGDLATKTVLAAIDTGLKGAGNAYDDHMLTGRSIDVLQKTMRSSRNVVRARIVESLSLSDAEYPLELALSDVESYYSAGTIAAGLNELSAASSIRLAASEDTLAATSAIARYSADDATAILRRYWRDGGGAAAAAINDWLAANRIRASITLFLNAEEYAADRLALRHHLGL